jgi:hypothetical protein
LQRTALMHFLTVTYPEMLLSIPFRHKTRLFQRVTLHWLLKYDTVDAKSFLNQPED